MDPPTWIDPPAWVTEDLPEENWHVDSVSLEHLHGHLRELCRIAMPDTILASLEKVLDAACECSSRDGDSDDDDEMQDTNYCPRRSNFKSDSNRTFLILEQILPRLNFAAQKLTSLIEMVSQRAAKSRCRWEAKVEERRVRAVRQQVRPDFGQPFAEVISTSPQEAHSKFGDLPTEVISLIISFASRTDSQAPFALSCVNTYLRQLALSTPLLWSELHVMDRIAKNAIKLERATTVPLTVNLSLLPWSFHFTKSAATAKLSRFITLLGPAQQRVQKVFAEPFHVDFLVLVVDFIRTANFQALETFHLGFQDQDQDQYEVEDLAFNGPIHELRLRRTLPAKPAGMFTHHIVHLELVRIVMPINVLKDALISMPGLQFLLLDEVNVQDEANVAVARVVLAHLRYLFVRFSAANIIIPMLETPSLGALHFGDSRRWLPLRSLGDDEKGLLVAITEDNPQLRRLHVEEWDMGPHVWSKVFYNLPELEYLRVKWCGIEGAHLSALGGLESETQEWGSEQRWELIACQKLQEIVFENELLISSGAILRIVKARCAVPEAGKVHRIRWITFRGCDADLITAEDIHAMAQLTRGIAVDLVDGKDAWEGSSDDSYVESGDDWKFSDWELEESGSEADEE